MLSLILDLEGEEGNGEFNGRDNSEGRSVLHWKRRGSAGCMRAVVVKSSSVAMETLKGRTTSTGDNLAGASSKAVSGSAPAAKPKQLAPKAAMKKEKGGLMGTPGVLVTGQNQK